MFSRLYKHICLKVITELTVTTEAYKTNITIIEEDYLKLHYRYVDQCTVYKT